MFFMSIACGAGIGGTYGKNKQGARNNDILKSPYLRGLQDVFSFYAESRVGENVAKCKGEERITRIFIKIDEVPRKGRKNDT